MSLNPHDLLATLISEFQPEKKAKASKAHLAPQPKDLLTSASREEYLESSPHWVPTHLVHHTVEQTCRCCGQTTESLGRTLVRHRNSVTHTDWEIQRGRFNGYDTLPQHFVPHEEVVEACPSCLRAEVVLCTFPPEHSRQIPLFH